MASLQAEDEEHGAFRARLSHEIVSQLSDEQLGYILVGGRITNEIVSLQRLVIAAQNSFRRETSDHKDATGADLLMLLLLLAGKTYEGRRALNNFSRLWHEETRSEHINTAIQAKRSLNKKLGPGSSLALVRNKASFHFDTSGLLASEINTLKIHSENDNGIVWIMGSTIGTTMYLFATYTNVSSMLSAAYPGLDAQKCFDSFYNDVIEAAGLLGRYYHYSFVGVLEMVRGAFDRIELTELDTSKWPSLDDLALPTFCRVPDKSGMN